MSLSKLFSKYHFGEGLRNLVLIKCQEEKLRVQNRTYIVIWNSICDQLRCSEIVPYRNLVCKCLSAVRCKQHNRKKCTACPTRITNTLIWDQFKRIRLVTTGYRSEIYQEMLNKNCSASPKGETSKNWLNKPTATTASTHSDTCIL
jgi:hypothetical protein